MVGGVFQGANQMDFSDAVTLYTVGAQPATGVFTSVSIASTTAFRYVRYLSPNNGWGNVAEVQFYGYQMLSTNSPVVLPSIGGGNLVMTWPLASAGFTLQSCTNLTGGQWMNVTSSAPQMLNGQWQMTLSILTNSPGAFYRLVK
jgi:hypothetical protein